MPKATNSENSSQKHEALVMAAALAWGGDVGPAALRKLVAECGSLPEVLQADAAKLRAAEPRLTPAQVERIMTLSPRLAEFAERINRMQRSGVQVLSVFDQQYPPQLAALRNPPPVICIRGAIIEADRVAVAVVGTRRPELSEVARTGALVRAFVAADITVVSGLAVGVDGAAHRAALAAGGRTIAVIGSGLERVYPPQHCELAEHVAACGAIVSELAPETRVAVGTLIARNRLIAALGAVTVVVASNSDGGSVVTAREAAKLEKPVAAVRWDSSHRTRAGNQCLLDDGAIAVDESNIAKVCESVRRSALRQAQTPSSLPATDHDPQAKLFD